MLETLKHTLYAGLGATVLTAEKIEAELQDLVKKGKLSAEDAREAAEKLSDESKKEYKEARKSLETAFEDMLKNAHVASQSDLEKLRKRINALEKQVEEMKKADA